MIRREQPEPSDDIEPQRAADGSPSRAPRRLWVLDGGDIDWISEAVEIVEQSQGQPWRVAFAAFDAFPVHPRNLRALRVGLARVIGGGSRLTTISRRVREVVLGPPALDIDARAARIASAAAQLGVVEDEIDALLFMDLPGERRIVLKHGRPNEIEIAAFANVALIQRALYRAHRVTVWLWGDDGTLLRAALSRGLLVTASHDPETGATMLEIVGPLALFQRTAIYGRALGQLVPLLSASMRFVLELETTHWRSRLESRRESPVLLPLAPIDRRGTYEPTRLARALVRFDPTMQILIGPSPIITATSILCPDLEVVHHGERWSIELVGFWTTEHLAKRLAAYANAGIVRVLFCIDEARGCADDETAVFAANVLRYARRIDPAEVVAKLASAKKLTPS